MSEPPRPAGRGDDGKAHQVQDNGRRISAVLDELMAVHADAPQISVGEIVDHLKDRAFGLLLLVFALPNVVPVGIPGVSTVLGVPLILLAFQLLIGRPMPWFPRWVRRRCLSRPKLAAALGHARPHIRRMERLLRPRLLLLTGPLGERLLALIALALAIILALPIPFGNWPPALAIVLFALALLERDGLFYVLGLCATLLAIAFLAGAGAAFLAAVMGVLGLGG